MKHHHLPLVLAVAVSLSACTMGGGPVPSTTDTPADGHSGLIPRTFDPQKKLIRLSHVFTSRNQPQNQLDLVGDGSGQIGQYCRALAEEDQANGIGTSTCRCVYRYTKTVSGVPSTQQLEINTTRYEDNLIRCPYRGGEQGFPVLDESVSLVTVMIGTATGFSSNALEIALIHDSDKTVIAPDGSVSAPGNPGSSDSDTLLRLPQTFLKVHQYQCRDNVYVAFGGYDKNVYDPALSEDLANQSTFNFYTTSIGTAMLALAQASSGDDPTSAHQFSCAFDAENPKYGDLYPWSDLRTTRSTPFYLARRAMGPYSVAVNSFLSPGIATSTPDSAALETGGDFASIGFAVRATRNGGDTSCPSDLPVPPGWEKVKIWPVRKSFEIRGYALPSPQVDILCDPGEVQIGDAWYNFFKNCGNSTGSLVSRVAGPPFTQNSACYKGGTDIDINGDIGWMSAEPSSRWDVRWVVTGTDVQKEDLVAPEGYFPILADPTLDEEGAIIYPLCTVRPAGGI